MPKPRPAATTVTHDAREQQDVVKAKHASRRVWESCDWEQPISGFVADGTGLSRRKALQSQT